MPARVTLLASAAGADKRFSHVAETQTGRPAVGVVCLVGYSSW